MWLYIYLFIYLFLIDELQLSYVGNIGKSEAFIVFVYDCCDWLKCFHTKETTFQDRV